MNCVKAEYGATLPQPDNGSLKHRYFGIGINGPMSTIQELYAILL